MSSTHAPPDLLTLIGLFYDEPEALAEFDEVSAASMPTVYQRLLDHQNHMTVTVEDFHGSPVDVRVIRKSVTATHYAREILLTRQSDGQVVQYGIMRVDLAYLDEPVRREIESESSPLGRILIEHDVMREVRLSKLWHVQPGPALAELFALQAPLPITYGRTAMIRCNGVPAIELLEIVTPEDSA